MPEPAETLLLERYRKSAASPAAGVPRRLRAAWAGPKSDAAPGAPRKGWGGDLGGGAAAAPSLDSSSTHNRNRRPLNRNPNCGVFTLCKRKDEDGKILYTCLRVMCRSYGCGVCGPRKATRLRKAIAAKAQALALTRFLTLTLDPSRIPADTDPVQYIRGEVWAKFRTYLKREYGKVVVYIAVLEFTQAGVPHLHVLVDRYIPQAWISRAWDVLGGGKIVFIERVHDMHRMAHYLAKYLTKDVILSAPKNVRRWTASLGIKLFEKRPSSGEWALLFLSFAGLYILTHWSRVAEERDNDGRVRLFETTEDPRAI